MSPGMQQLFPRNLHHPNWQTLFPSVQSFVSRHRRIRRRSYTFPLSYACPPTIASLSYASARRRRQHRVQDSDASAILHPASNHPWRSNQQWPAKDIKKVLADALRQLLDELNASGCMIGREALVSCMQAHGLSLDHRTLHSFVLQILKSQARTSQRRACMPRRVSHGGEAESSSINIVVSDREEMGVRAHWHVHEVCGRDGRKEQTGDRESVKWHQVSAIIAEFESVGVQPNERIYTTIISHAGKDGRMDLCWKWFDDILVLQQQQQRQQQQRQQQPIGVGKRGNAVAACQVDGVTSECQTAKREETEREEAETGEAEAGEADGTRQSLSVPTVSMDLCAVMAAACAQNGDWRGATDIFRHIQLAASPQASAAAPTAVTQRVRLQCVRQRVSEYESGAVAHLQEVPSRGTAAAPRCEAHLTAGEAAAEQLCRSVTKGGRLHELQQRKVLPSSMPWRRERSIGDEDARASTQGEDDEPVKWLGQKQKQKAQQQQQQMQELQHQQQHQQQRQQKCQQCLRRWFQRKQWALEGVVSACARAGRWQLARDLLEQIEAEEASVDRSTTGGGKSDRKQAEMEMERSVSSNSSCCSLKCEPSRLRGSASEVWVAAGGAVKAGGTVARGKRSIVAAGVDASMACSSCRPLSPGRPSMPDASFDSYLHGSSARMYSEVISACGRARQPEAALALLSRLEHRAASNPQPLLLTVPVYSAAVFACASTGRWEFAVAILDRMEGLGLEPNVVTWSSAIMASSVAGRADVAREMLRKMQRSGCRPNVATWTAVIRACGQAGEWEAAEDAAIEMEALGEAMTEVTWSALLAAYGHSGQVSHALRALSLMQHLRMEVSLAAWNAALHACRRSQQWKPLGRILQQMAAAGCEPNVVTYGTVVEGYGVVGKAGRARQVFDDMLQQGVRPNAVVCSAMVRAYGRAKKFGQAMKFFDDLPSLGVVPDKYIFTALLWACGFCGHWQQAPGIFSRMKELGILPDDKTYNTLIQTYESHGQWELAIQALDDMNKMSRKLLSLPQKRP